MRGATTISGRGNWRHTGRATEAAARYEQCRIKLSGELHPPDHERSVGRKRPKAVIRRYIVNHGTGGLSRHQRHSSDDATLFRPTGCMHRAWPRL
jgi:hypothetical protein